MLFSGKGTANESGHVQGLAARAAALAFGHCAVFVPYFRGEIGLAQQGAADGYCACAGLQCGQHVICAAETANLDKRHGDIFMRPARGKFSCFPWRFSYAF